MTLPQPREGLLLGVDTSAAQGRLRHAELQAAGVSFAYHKATEGVRYVDPQWAASAEGSASAGLLFGAYGFLRPRLDVKAQAFNFVRNVRGVPCDLPPALDFELADGMTAIAALRAASEWLDIVEAELGRECIVYTMPAFIAELAEFAGAAGDEVIAHIARRPLWVAHYTQDDNNPPHLPPGWLRWAMWQRSGGRKVSRNAAQLPGTTLVDVDVDWMRVDDFRAFTAVPQPSEASNEVRQMDS